MTVTATTPRIGGARGRRTFAHGSSSGSTALPRASRRQGQAARLLVSDGQLTLLTAYDIPAILVGGLGGGVPTYLEALAATGERPVDDDGLVELRRRFDPAAPVGSTGSGKASSLFRWSDRPPVEALLVVGSRGLHGRAALGSVSERIAHEAHYCSVLVIREATWD